MDKNNPDLWSFCIARPLSDILSLVIATASFGKISDNFHAFLQQKNCQREKTDCCKCMNTNNFIIIFNIIILLLIVTLKKH